MPEPFDELVQRIKANVKTNPLIESISIDDNIASEEQLIQLLELLQTNTTVEFVKFKTTLLLNSQVASLIRQLLQVNQTIRHLVFHETPLSVASAQALTEGLSANTNLEIFKFDNQWLSHEVFQVVIEGLKRNRSLQNFRLNISSTNLSNELALAEAIRQHPALQVLNLTGQATPKIWKLHNGLFEIIASLEFSPRLSLVHIEYHQLSDQHVLELARILQTNTTIHYLTLDSCLISSTGGIALAKALQHNRHLEYIDLNNNCLEALGLLAFAEMLKTNKKLTFLRLSWNYPNGYTREHSTVGQQFAAALRKNSHLGALSLVGAHINDRGAKALARALLINRRITHLYLYHNPISASGCLAFGKTLILNRSLIYVELPDNISRKAMMTFVSVYKYKLIRGATININNQDISEELAKLTIGTNELKRFFKLMFSLSVLNHRPDSLFYALPIDTILYLLDYLKPEYENGKADLLPSPEQTLTLASHLLTCPNCQRLEMTVDCQARDSLKPHLKHELIITPSLKATQQKYNHYGKLRRLSIFSIARQSSAYATAEKSASASAPQGNNSRCHIM